MNLKEKKELFVFWTPRGCSLDPKAFPELQRPNESIFMKFSGKLPKEIEAEREKYNKLMMQGIKKAKFHPFIIAKHPRKSAKSRNKANACTKYGMNDFDYF